MSISDRRRRKTEDIRGWVFEVSGKGIPTYGTLHVTMRRIASNIEYARTVLYRVFGSENALTDHLIASGHDAVGRRYKEVMSRIDLAPLQGHPEHSVHR